MILLPFNILSSIEIETMDMGNIIGIDIIMNRVSFCLVNRTNRERNVNIMVSDIIITFNPKYKLERFFSIPKNIINIIKNTFKVINEII